jgi:CheY-like chemotaxis protein
MVKSAYVLVVEDDVSLAETVGSLLRSEGYQIEVATSAGDALDRLQATELPCLILLDLLMPEVDGFTFLRRQRADTRLAKVPVCVMSALIARDGPFPGQADCALAKPIDQDLLREVVRRYCTPPPDAAASGT